MPDTSVSRLPGAFRVALAVLIVQALAVAAYGVAELFAVTSGRLTMGLTTGIFLIGYAAGLGWAAAALAGRRIRGRSIAVLAQVIWLGVAWSFRGGTTTWLAVVLAGSALVVLAGLLHPATTRLLVEEDSAAAR